MTGPEPPWAEQLRGLVEGLPGGLGGLGGFVADVGSAAGEDHAAECRSCPVCTALAVLRGRRPDLSEALADVLAAASGALRTLSRPADGTAASTSGDATTTDATTADATSADATSADATPRGAGDPDPGPAPAPAPVQRIEVA
ncbi:hypothetical protein TEK04_04955 [Klenkia sp. LSe6-5]|uniref:Uncharacterized protein n=1 Tax=Klenkia sesuvii TaxID=3103137 RepID=A0ABU8DQE5_9ACTN